MTPQEIEKAISDLETSLDRLHALYNQYFMGIEKREPIIVRKAVDRKIYALRRVQIKNTAQRFRFQTQVQKYNTQTTYWRRICRQIEEGTYHRQIMLAKRRQDARTNQADEKPRDEISDIVDTSKPIAKERLKAYELNMDEPDGFDLDDPFGSVSSTPAGPADSIDSLDDPFSSAPKKKPAEKQAAPPPKKEAPKRKIGGKALPRSDAKSEEGIKKFFSKSLPPPPPPPPPPPSRGKRQQIKASSEPAKAPAMKSAGASDFDLKRAKKIYRTYVAARKKCNESTDNLTLEKVTRSLKKQHNAKEGNVDFKVVIRGGKAAIKAVKK
ncbi:MAG: hypothetical protein GY854_22895 [Deltaproteobacteria bacterium]|nr:hypothetical protein [Deltaproteobacteria bacterium]